MSKWIALIIGNTAYQDEILSQLIPPDADVQALANCLANPQSGNFTTVTTLLNRPTHELKAALDRFLKWKKPQDSLLLYWLGHTLQDERGQVYLTTTDTDLKFLDKTALPASFIAGAMDRSFSRQQILILDSHNARYCFDHGHTDRIGDFFDLGVSFQGRGRTVIGAAATTHYLLGPGHILGTPSPSHFTRYVLRSLETGAADLDHKGHIDLDDLYTYVTDQLAAHGHPQKPRRWLNGQQHSLTPTPLVQAPVPEPVQPPAPIKWDLLFGAILAPLSIIFIGAWSSLTTAIGLASIFALLYSFLYLFLE